MWDERYAEPDYAYGKEPNDFLRSVADRLPPGPVLCLAEGQGRNACYLAGRGHAVTALDSSAVGLARARALAVERGVEITTLHGDLAVTAIEPEAWSGVVAIFCHLPPALRSRVLRGSVQGLRRGGVFVLESYRPEQLELGTGGPRDASLLASLAELRADLEGLELVHAAEVTRDVREGKYHQGLSATVQILGVRR
jgi:SAM-dependent methyltransferase